jgi:anhydro-N-acetylmuramic acid kinase
LLAGFGPVDLVGFHGQTLAHRPDDRITHQAGDGAALALALGRPVVWDFRTADVTLGGQGAPLAPFFHFACARWIGATEPLAFLNIGGVANLTWIDPACPRPRPRARFWPSTPAPGTRRSTISCGAARPRAGRRTGGSRRRAGSTGRRSTGCSSGRISTSVPPKSLDRDDFAGLAGAVAHLSDADGAATLAFAVAASVAQGLAHCPTVPARLLVTGGGRRNPTIMAMLARATGIPVAPVEDGGLDGDMLEAQAFAYLAVRVARGWPTSAPGTTGVAAPVGGGRLSRPGLAPVDVPTPLRGTGSA